MSIRWPVTFVLLLLLLGSSGLASDKAGARLEKISDATATDLRVRQSLITADTCTFNHNGEIIWRINGWVTGQELYKSLMDPAAGCEGPYPFTVTEINMPMMFDDSTTLTVAVDVESVDYESIPGCPIPGDVLAMSQDFDLEVPVGGGFFNIWIPLDTPLVVTEPFFAGFYIGNAIAESAGAAIVTDSIPVQCVTYNIWEGAEGWIDMVNNSIYNFPGRLAMEVSGIPGGSGPEPPPQIVLLSPSDGDTLLGHADLWAYDTSGSSILDYASFEYSSGGPYIEIGRDFDGHRPLRDGVSDVDHGAAFNLDWIFSLLPEGPGSVRVTIVDTLGRMSSTTITTYLEPTPPIPRITTPDNGDDICAPTTIIMSSSDENMTYVELYRSDARLDYSVGATPMSQHTVGDVNANPADDNLAINGEYGDYYCGPVAVAVALQIWADRGIQGLVGGNNPIDSVAEELARLFKTRVNLGTYDEDILTGVLKYSFTHGDNLRMDFMRNPDYYELRTWVEDEQRVVIVGLSGEPGLYLTIDGFPAWANADSNKTVSAANPITGTIQNVLMRDDVLYSEISIDGTWQRVDIMISIMAKNWSVTRTALGIDFTGGDGWSFDLSSTGMTEDSLYFIRADGRDANQYAGSSTVLIRNNCSDVYQPGDYDNDASTDIGDLFILIDLITQGGAAPAGGTSRADANCDGYVNVVDIVYYMNFLFGGTAPPCY